MTYNILAPNYSNAIVAFVDIMGFKKLIEKTETDRIFFDTILDILRTFAKKNKRNSYNYDGKEVTIDSNIGFISFSDSVLIYKIFDNDTNKLSALLSVCFAVGDLSGLLLEQGYCARSGITIGKIYHENDQGEIFFGPAVNRAYLLEENEAIYPRIIIDESLKEVTQTVNSFFPRDFDGALIFDHSFSISLKNLYLIRSHIVANLNVFKLGTKENRYWYYIAQKVNDLISKEISKLNLILPANQGTPAGDDIEQTLGWLKLIPLI